ncbi:MAG TPA: ABC transporter substrate-binding protein, partial [Burkholderiaceae bacterium]|nr:ABC transporter substrate-binding protein [Burkholderiaceae bacterium]
MGRSLVGVWVALLIASSVAAADAQRTSATKVLRYAVPAAETGFDPAQVTDLYSNTVITHIFEAPLEYEYLAQPVRVRPNTATALPEVSSDYRDFVFTIRPGIYFTDDPAFKGRRRELTAQDYVYTIKRHYDPRWKSGKLYLFDTEQIVGLSELRREALDRKTPFDYDREVTGLRALDRYRFEVKLAQPSPRFYQLFADASSTGAVAREVVEHYGDHINEHPVGTGPFKLSEWRRSSRMVLTRNPGFRELRYHEHPAAGDAPREAIAR